jgi:hypothetical protein
MTEYSIFYRIESASGSKKLLKNNFLDRFFYLFWMGDFLYKVSSDSFELAHYCAFIRIAERLAYKMQFHADNSEKHADKLPIPADKGKIQSSISRKSLSFVRNNKKAGAPTKREHWLF